MRREVRYFIVLLAAIACAVSLPAVACASAQPPLNLGACASYGVLAAHEFYNTGSSTVVGDLGVGITGHPMPSGITVTGTQNLGNAAAKAAITDMEAAFAEGMSRSNDATITGDLGGRTLPPGVYHDGDAETFDINGVLTLDAQGDPNAAWVFQSTSGLDVGPDGRIVLANGARFCRVFWVVRTANLAAGSQFEGHILAQYQIIAGAGATVRGQLMSSRNGGNDGWVTLDSNRIDDSAYVCAPYTPRLPKTGYPPEETAFPWGIAAGLITVLVVALSGVAAWKGSAPTEGVLR